MTSLENFWYKLNQTKHGKEYFFSSIIILIALLVSAIFLKGYVFYGKSQVLYSYKVETKQTAQAKQSTHVYHDIHALKGFSKISAGTKLTVLGYDAIKHHNQKELFAKVKVDGQTLYVMANAITLKQSNAINRYIANLGYPKVSPKQDIYSKFKKEAYHTQSKQPKGIVIHDTGTENSTLAGEKANMENDYRDQGVFVHSFIDDKEILTIANPNYMAQGAGPKANPYYLQFEMVHVYQKKAFAKQIANAAYYTALMLNKYNLGITLGQKNGQGTVWTHEMVSEDLGGTNHIDPSQYWEDSASQFFQTDYDVEDFVQLVQAYYNRL